MTEVSDRAEFTFPPNFTFTEELHFPLMEYVREVKPSEGYYDVERVMKALQEKLVDKNGEKIDPVEYVKSTLNVFKVGCMLALKTNGKILIGYSQWADKVDEYDRLNMFDVAVQRAYALENRRPKVIPFKIANALPKFLNRAKAYYKDAVLIGWAQDFLVDPKPFLAPGGPQYDEELLPHIPESFFNDCTGQFKEVEVVSCGCTCNKE